ncbi:CMRF35-like molecule 1 [Pungitius pungitius]|uniref:CMRF35-like molecule 1 n=1 Tax=Pungitius pungitius TaxID=134920 RepID=UPI002E0D832B
MIKIFTYFCLLSGLSVVQMNPLFIQGRVGESVTISCSDWNVWTDVTEDAKYFCSSPCTKDQHIIIKAGYGKTTNKNRIKLHNKGKTLLVTFKSLQKSDSETYYCGVDRTGKADAYIMVILNVMDVTTSSTMSSNSSDVFTETSTSHTTLNTTTPAAPAQGSDNSVLYLVVGVTSVLVVITILMVSLKLMNMMMKRQSSKIHIKIQLKHTLQIRVYFSQASTRQMNT